MLDFDLHFITLIDMFDSFRATIEFPLENDYCRQLFEDTMQVTQYLLKMVQQNTDFLAFSHSRIVLSCFYSATALYKSQLRKEDKLTPEAEALLSKIDRSLMTVSNLRNNLEIAEF